MFKGAWIEGKKKGEFKETLKNGAVISSRYENGERVEEEEVSIKYTNGDFYVGEISGFNRHGLGTLSYKNGDFQYRGNWKHDKKHGRGAWKSKDQNIVFTGNFKDGLKHGENCTWENMKTDESYIGSF